LYQGRGLLKYFKLVPRTITYRNKGLGTALLNFVFEHFKGMGCERMEGKIVKSDLIDRPWLPQWYRKHGFHIPDSGVGQIWKVLV